MSARKITMPGWREIGAGAVVDLHVERQAVHGGGMNRGSIKRVKIGERLERDEGWVVADVRAPREAAEPGDVVELAGNDGAHLAAGRVRSAVVELALDAERIARQGQHPTELAGTDDRDLHVAEPSRGSGRSATAGGT